MFSAFDAPKRGDGWLLFGALLKRHTVFPLDDVPIKRKIDGETRCKKPSTRRRLPKELKLRVGERATDGMSQTHTRPFATGTRLVASGGYD
jgi:hypothetical protein